jgi:uncharacterized YigZ family protein
MTIMIERPQMPYPEGPDSYQSVAGVSHAEIKEQRSLFVAEATAAAALEAAKTFVAEVSRRYHDCRHVAYAWRGGVGAQIQESRSDGGEPSGTAGEPILAAIRRATLSDTVVAVARYFGGIKLGTGGLARAYGAAADAALAAAERRTINLGSEGAVTFAYPHQKTLAHLLTRHGGRLIAEQYAQDIIWRIWLPQSAWNNFMRAVAAATAGQAHIKAPAPRDRS